MENLYLETTRLLSDTQEVLQRIITAPGNIEETQLKENLQQLEQDVYRLQTMAKKEVPSRKQEARMKVEQLRMDFESLQRAYESHQRRISEAEKDAQQREELMTRRYTTNSSGRSSDTSIAMGLDHTIRENERLTTASSAIDSMLAHGSNVLSDLRNQAYTLKGAHRKLLDLASTLGLSNTVMRLIEKRTHQDKWIFWTGICITSAVILLLIYYFAS